MQNIGKGELKLQDRGFSALPPLCQPTSQQSSSIEGGAKSISKKMVNGDTLHLEIEFVVCFGAEENQAHCCDPYGLRVQDSGTTFIFGLLQHYYFHSYRSSPIEVKIVMLEQTKNKGCS